MGADLEDPRVSDHQPVGTKHCLGGEGGRGREGKGGEGEGRGGGGEGRGRGGGEEGINKSCTVNYIGLTQQGASSQGRIAALSLAPSRECVRVYVCVSVSHTTYLK